MTAAGVVLVVLLALAVVPGLLPAAADRPPHTPRHRKARP